jgi:hypothetical protein
MTRFGAQPVAVYEDIGSLPATAKAFLAEYRSGELCLSGSWFELLAGWGLKADQRPRIYVVAAESVVDCVMFAMCLADGRRPRRLASLANFYTMSYAPLLRHDLDDSQRPLDILARYIAAERPAWDIVDLAYLISEQPISAQLFKAFRRAGFLVGRYFQFQNWFLPTSGLSAEQYFKSRPSQVRNTVTRKLKKARKEHELGVDLYDSPRDLAQGLDAYQRIYAQSWKVPEALPEFIPRLVANAAERGSLRLGVLRVDGEPAAAQIWLISSRKATIYKLAYDEKYAALSAGTILTKMMFDHVLDCDDVDEVDYGVGSEHYKLDWMSECRHVSGLVCFNRASVIGLLAAARHFIGRVKWLRHEPADAIREEVR